LNVITRTTSQRQHFHLLLFFYAPARTQARTQNPETRTRNLKRVLTPAQLSPPSISPFPSHQPAIQKNHTSLAQQFFPFWCFLFCAFHFFQAAFSSMRLCPCPSGSEDEAEAVRQLGNSQLGNSGPITRHLFCAPPVELCFHKNCFACSSAQFSSVQSLSSTLEVLGLIPARRRCIGGVLSWPVLSSPVCLWPNVPTRLSFVETFEQATLYIRIDTQSGGQQH